MRIICRFREVVVFFFLQPQVEQLCIVTHPNRSPAEQLFVALCLQPPAKHRQLGSCNTDAMVNLLMLQNGEHLGRVIVYPLLKVLDFPFARLKSTLVMLLSSTAAHAA